MSRTVSSSGDGTTRFLLTRMGAITESGNVNDEAEGIVMMVGVMIRIKDVVPYRTCSKLKYQCCLARLSEP